MQKVEPYDDPVEVLLEDVPLAMLKRIGFYAVLVLAVVVLAAAYGCGDRIVPGSERKVAAECALHSGLHHWFSEKITNTPRYMLTAVCNDGVRVSDLLIEEAK